MDEFKNVDGILDFAIAREEEAAEFYSNLAQKIDDCLMLLRYLLLYGAYGRLFHGCNVLYVYCR